MSARTVAAIFDADISRYVRKVLEMRHITIETSKQISGVAVKNKADWDRVGGGLLKTGALMAGGLGAVTVAAMGWESAFAGVRKTVDESDTGFVTLESDLRQLAKTMATSHEEIAAVAENAGALGVKTKDVANFTRTMVMLGETTNLSADEASTALSQLMLIMDTAPSKVGNLAAEIVELGNNGASTEKQIVELAQRLAGAARAVGLNEAQLLAYSSAIASTGMNVEAGGTAMSKVFTKLERLTLSSGKGLAALNEMTGTDFKQAFEQDASGAVQLLIEKLGDFQAKGGSVTKFMDQIGIKGVYETDVIRRLAGAHGLLADQLGIGEKSYQAATAALEEYQKRAATSESKVKVAWNNIKDSAIDAGQAMLPLVAGGAQDVARFVGAWQELPGPVKAAAGSLAVAAATGALVLGGGMKVVGVVSSMAEAYGKLAAESPKAAAGIRKAAAAAAVFAVATAALKAFTSAYDDAASAARTKSADISVAMLGNKLDFGRIFGAEQKNVFTKEAFSAADALRRAFSPQLGDQLADAVWGSFGIGTSGSRIKESVAEVDKALTGLAASGNTEAAFKGYRDFVAFVGSSGVPIEQVRPALTGFRQQLDTIAEGLGLQGQISEGEFVKWMGGEIPAAVRTATAAGGPLVNNLTDQQRAFAGAGGAASDAATDVAAYTAALWGASDAAVKLSGSKIGFEAAIDDTRSTIEGNKDRRGKGTKVGTSTSMNYAVNRENKTALDELRDSTQAYVNTLIEQDAGVGKATAAMKRGRDQYVAAAIAAGYGLMRRSGWLTRWA